MARIDGRRNDELRPISMEQQTLVVLCQKGIGELMAKQRAVLEGKK